MISMIWAMDRNRLIGRANALPWHIPADLAYFKSITFGHTVVMGRKTYQAIGKLLPGRDNLVVTRDAGFHAEGCRRVQSTEAVLELAREKEVFIIGGAQIYTLFLPHADRLYVTLIDHAFTGDVYFPPVDFSDWQLLSKQAGVYNEENPFHYSFLVYEKRGLLSGV